MSLFCLWVWTSEFCSCSAGFLRQGDGSADEWGRECAAVYSVTVDVVPVVFNVVPAEC